MRRGLVTGLVLVLVAAVLGGLLLARGGKPEQRQLSVMFPSTTSLYEGAQVKVLGVRIGTVDSIEVEGTQVRVEISYDRSIKLPADVHAVVVPPSVVGDRFIQLAPAYAEGAVLADDAHLGLERSSVPLELDDTYRALDQVASDLGPEGANRDGALSRLITASAKNLKGRGQLLNSTVRELADAIAVVAGSSGDINATTSNLATLNEQLVASDTTIRSLVANLVAVSTELNSQSGDLTEAVRLLDRTFARVARFSKDNRETLRQNVGGLTSTTSALRRHTHELEEIADLAPVGLVNLLRTYVPRNWDPTDRKKSVVEGRTGSQALHAALFNDLDTQLAYLVSGICDALPVEAAAQLLPLCNGLEEVGFSLGGLLSSVAEGSPGVLDPSPREKRGTGR